MCLYNGTQWCSVCGEEEGSMNQSLGNPSDQLMCFGYLPSPGYLKKTDQSDSIQTSEMESQWCSVMRGWTEASDDWPCQKRQIDPAKWGLMIWNRLLQFAELQWLRLALSQVEWALLKPDCFSIQFVVLGKKQWDLVEDNSFEYFNELKKRNAEYIDCKVRPRSIYMHSFRRRFYSKRLRHEGYNKAISLWGKREMRNSRTVQKSKNMGHHETK